MRINFVIAAWRPETLSLRELGRGMNRGPSSMAPVLLCRDAFQYK